MPRQKRYDIKQRISTILDEIDRAQGKLALVDKEYADAAEAVRSLRETYPNLYDEVLALEHEALHDELVAYFQGLQIIRDGLSAFSDKI